MSKEKYTAVVKKLLGKEVEYKLELTAVLPITINENLLKLLTIKKHLWIFNHFLLKENFKNWFYSE